MRVGSSGRASEWNLKVLTPSMYMWSSSWPFLLTDERSLSRQMASVGPMHKRHPNTQERLAYKYLVSQLVVGQQESEGIAESSLPLIWCKEGGRGSLVCLLSSRPYAFFFQSSQPSSPFHLSILSVCLKVKGAR
jgi:hypothetical protein